MTIERMQITQVFHSEPEDPLFGLTAVEVNPTELCNRTCSFCPRVDPDVYPNRNLHMSLDTLHRLVDNLAENNYKGRMVFSGFGEPTLNKKILEMIRIARNKLTDVQMYTNGDKILDDSWYTLQEFIDAGLTSIFIDVYDSPEQHRLWNRKIEPYLSQIPIHLSAKYNFPIHIFTNRSGTVKTKGIRQTALPKHCYIPHTKAFVDWDGTVLLCCNDWARAAGGFGNVNDIPFTKIWMSEQLVSIRKKLVDNDRRFAGTPCNLCDATGNQKVETWIKDVWSKKHASIV